MFYSTDRIGLVRPDSEGCFLSTHSLFDQGETRLVQNNPVRSGLVLIQTALN